jgi:hypothetical protein
MAIHTLAATTATGVTRQVALFFARVVQSGTGWLAAATPGRRWPAESDEWR